MYSDAEIQAILCAWEDIQAVLPTLLAVVDAQEQQIKKLRPNLDHLEYLQTWWLNRKLSTKSTGAKGGVSALLSRGRSVSRRRTRPNGGPGQRKGRVSGRNKSNR